MEQAVKELLLYSEKVSKEDFKSMFGHLTKRSVSLMGFIDLSYIFSSIPSPIILKRSQNTLRFYAKEKKELVQLSDLLFPFKLGDSTTIERARGSFFPFPKFYFLGGENILNFMIKEDIVEFTFNIRRVLGKFIGVATSVDSHGRKGIIFLSKPEVFFEIDLEKNPAIYIEVLEPIPKSISLTSAAPVFEGVNTKIGVDSYESIQHSLIIGESGSGKTKALFMLIRALEKHYGDKIRIVILDPHGEFIQAMPEHKVIDFKSNYIEPLDIGGEKSPLMTQLIAQLISSAIGEENKYAERVLFYSTYLLSSIDKLSLKCMSAMLTDPATRMEYSTKSDVDEARRFFDQEYQDIYIHHFNSAVLPILNFVGEYELYLGKEMRQEKLLDCIHKSPVTIVSFDPNFFGKRMIKFLAGAIINQMYILAITGKLKQQTMLVVDEFPRVETLVVKDILAETRKFNLYLLLSMQYMGQLRKEILDAIVSNTRNIISFKTNRVDASLVSSIMEIKLEEYFKKNRTTTELEESKKEMFVRLNQRECVVRLFDGKKYLLPMKLKSVHLSQWGFDDAQLRRIMADSAVSHGAGQAGGKPTGPEPAEKAEAGQSASIHVAPPLPQEQAREEKESEEIPRKKGGKDKTKKEFGVSAFDAVGSEGLMKSEDESADSELEGKQAEQEEKELSEEPEKEGEIGEIEEPEEEEPSPLLEKQESELMEKEEAELSEKKEELPEDEGTEEIHELKETEESPEADHGEKESRAMSVLKKLRENMASTRKSAAAGKSYKDKPDRKAKPAPAKKKPEKKKAAKPTKKKGKGKKKK